MMKNFSLGQAWISRVTKASGADVSIVGVDVSQAPEMAQFHAVLRELSLTETAREIARRKWIQPKGIKDKVAERGEALFDFLCARSAHQPALAMFKGRRLSAQRDFVEDIATMAWVAHVLDSARANAPRVKFKASSLSSDFIRKLAKLSVRDDGPRRALAAIREIGIGLVIESGLPGMSVDGASVHTRDAGPVLALTLRYDRLDNFWFTLLHELGHIALHLSDPSDDVFIDSLEDSSSDEQEAEAEANAFAKDGLIPRDLWLRSDAYRLGTAGSVLSLANQIGVHPAIVAGRIRYERRDFRIFSDLVGMGGVRDVIFSDA
jgi:HTH-type transcriptional regulator / antitoxin HigA